MKNELLLFKLEIFFSGRGMIKQQKCRVSQHDPRFPMSGGQSKYMNACKLCPIRYNYF